MNKKTHTLANEVRNLLTKYSIKQAPFAFYSVYCVKFNHMLLSEFLGKEKKKKKRPK